MTTLTKEELEKLTAKPGAMVGLKAEGCDGQGNA